MAKGVKRNPEFVASGNLPKSATGNLQQDYLSTVDLGKDFVPASDTSIQTGTNVTINKTRNDQ